VKNGEDKAEDRKGKFIAVANMKGGVGKTTTVVSLAEALAADDLNASVLVVDLDPQASASLCLAGDDVLADLIEEGRTLQDFLETRLIAQDKKQSIDDYIRHHFSFTTHRNEQLALSLMPCGPELRLLEREIIYALTKRKFSMNAIEGHLWKLFEVDFTPLRKAFDYVIFDCPPGISPFAEVTIRAADLIVVPTIPDRISNFGLNAFCLGFWKSNLSSLPVPPKPTVLISRVQDVKQHNQMIKRLELEASEKDAAFNLFKTRIPQSAALAEALSMDGVQTFTKKYTLKVAQILSPLTQEIRGMLDGD
jgi:cellulose biosynthesis protein BcsQ